MGALLADMNRPVSVHVGLTHALRLAELHFPPPDAWNELVGRLLRVPEKVEATKEVLEPAVQAR